MIVRRDQFIDTVQSLIQCTFLSLDTETTGLRPYHGSRLFSIIIGSGVDTHYFNFNKGEIGVSEDLILDESHIEGLKELFARKNAIWFMHNARFDLHMLANEGISVEGDIWCTQTGAVLENNTYLQYNLKECAGRIGLLKSEDVEKYITDNGLWHWEEIPGRKTRKKNKHYHKVPLDIIASYAEQDARITYSLGMYQRQKFQEIIDGTPETLPSLSNLHRNERDLTKTVFRMERLGIQIDRDYCMRASRYETCRIGEFAAEYFLLTGRDFKDSSRAFEDTFQSEREKWKYTEKGNPSFDSDTLKTFDNPAARAILGYRDAKSKRDFYEGYLYHADSNGVVHPNLNPAGAPATGRFSSSDPNFQNLTAEDWGTCRECNKGFESVEEKCPYCGSDKICQSEFLVRRAIVPRPGYFFIMPDYSQMEYCMMFDYACMAVGYETPLVKKIKEGFDPHQAMADTVTAAGFPLTRSRAKNGNFAKLYGAGHSRFAETVGCSLVEARRIMTAISRGAPEIDKLISKVERTAKHRGYVFNWFGRRFKFDDAKWAYRAPNYIIQGGAADVVKVAMNRIDKYLADTKSRMILTVHDELLIEVHESDKETVPKMVQEIMESVLPWKYLPLKTSMEHSYKSFADKVKGMPV